VETIITFCRYKK